MQQSVMSDNLMSLRCKCAEIKYWTLINSSDVADIKAGRLSCEITQTLGFMHILKIVGCFVSKHSLRPT